MWSGLLLARLGSKTFTRARTHRSRCWRAVALAVPVVLLVACGGKRRGGARGEHDAGVLDAQVRETHDASVGDGGRNSAADTGHNSTIGLTDNVTLTFGSGTSDTSGSDNANTYPNATYAPGSSAPDHTSAPNASNDTTSDATANNTSTTASNTDSQNATGTDDSSSQATSGPLLPLPSGCTSTYELDASDRCQISTKCGEVTDFLICNPMPLGGWTCDCTGLNNHQTYEIEGASGLNACRAFAHVCTDDPPEFGDYACIPRTTSGELSCDTAMSCGRPVLMDLGAGVTARVAETTTSLCNQMNDGTFLCTCTQGNEITDYVVQAGSAASACEDLADVCSGAEIPAAEGPESCTTGLNREDQEGCSIAQGCETSVESVNGSIITETKERSASCTVSGPTTSSCMCAGPGESFYFRVETTQPSCETASLNCNKNAIIIATGEASCTPTSQNAGVGYCAVDLECTQPATVDGRAIVADGRLNVYCRQDERGSWWCSCASNRDSEVFEVGAPEQSGWDVCSVAPAECRELLPIHLGPYVRDVPIVDPLPEVN